MVVLIIMGCALLLFGAFVVLCRQHDMVRSGVRATSMDVEPTSVALVLVIGAAMVVLGAYPMDSSAAPPELAVTVPATDGSLQLTPIGGFSATVEETGVPTPGG